jgi:hypothetical protein
MLLPEKVVKYLIWNFLLSFKIVFR